MIFSQKPSFARRQWAKYSLFFFFSQHLFQSFWLLLFIVNQTFSQKWRSKLSKAKFCSKAVSPVFAVFLLLSTSFPIILINIVWCQSNFFSEMKVTALKSEVLLEDSGHNICCFCSFLNIFSNQFDHYCLMLINYFLRNGAWRSQNRSFARRQLAQYSRFLFFSQHLFQSNWGLLFDVNQWLSQKWSPKFSKARFCSKTVSTKTAKKHCFCVKKLFVHITFEGSRRKKCSKSLFLKKYCKKGFVGFSTLRSSIVDHEVVSIVDH